MLTKYSQPTSGAEWGIAAKLRQKAAEKRRIEERRAKVELYRSYRTGELPDIQGVKVSGFVATMEQMASKDTTAACAVVSSIAKMIFDQVQDCQLDLQVSNHDDTRYCSGRCWSMLVLHSHLPRSLVMRNLQVLEGIYKQVYRCLLKSPSHSGYVRCLAEIAAVGAGCWISPQILLSCGRSSSEYQAMVFLLEKQVTQQCFQRHNLMLISHRSCLAASPLHEIFLSQQFYML